MTFKKLCKSILPNNFYTTLRHWKQNHINCYYYKSYSQEGEDMILRTIFENKKNGFYVDVGAFHPKIFSNTHFFYKQGWHGINIDANPKSMTAFRKLRPHNINLEIGIGTENNLRPYYIDPDLPTNNSFQPTTSNQECIQYLKTEPLSIILDKYLPKNTIIDFISIDVEGLEIEVLQSNNWQKYKPKIILAEDRNFKEYNLTNSKVYQFIITQGYKLYAKTRNTLIFKQNE
jgi:FkbM family methyltransferase